MKTRHQNKFNRKDTHIERKDLKIDRQWFEYYKDCVLEDREVWVLDVRTKKQADLITW